jgi:hypothetical protein
VLFRKPWGETPWTRVEETAIKELCLEEGWSRLFFVRLDSTSDLPKWVPKPHIYLDLTKFTLADLAGAIKARLQELGVIIVGPTLVERAAAQAAKRAFNEETKQVLERSANEFNQARDAVLDAIKEMVPDLCAATGGLVECGVAPWGLGFVVTGFGQSVVLRAVDLYANTARSAHLQLTEFSQAIPVQKPGFVYNMWRELDASRTHSLHIHRVQERGWCWELDRRILTPRDTAELILDIFLARIDRSHGA